MNVGFANGSEGASVASIETGKCFVQKHFSERGECQSAKNSQNLTACLLLKMLQSILIQGIFLIAEGFCHNGSGFFKRKFLAE
ncbi:hypothetical protein FEA44_00450 [Mannheimia haemolytica]|uniref:Uncharacterized protein n=1 Tax=Mannheimia haemolytica TaxID=75985 RepID=A0A547ESI9_MANHA|nr:hypothetical protein D650_27685 [Mannheimia haemolytica USDA-ARS-USMARC-183]ASW16682.1 hypothetical protein D648_25730 [Mannheimia haemolytica USDA-ARS-USMARC-185]ASW35543.1 hypothetical protein CKG23_02345 [Mannheimia haemolytica]AWW70721.1 hypothetical protein C4O86_02495 [Pasteurellaceae bacterium 12565]ASW65361.1 hypothetical protein CKG22_02690 [Mannheimia haemolytica]